MLISRLEQLGLGILTRPCPPELVDRVVGEAGRSEKRRSLLSARFTVYFVLAMCLFPQADYLDVLRLVKTGDPGLRSWTGVNKSSLTRHQRLRRTDRRAGIPAAGMEMAQEVRLSVAVFLPVRSGDLCEERRRGRVAGDARAGPSLRPRVSQGRPIELRRDEAGARLGPRTTSRGCCDTVARGRSDRSDRRPAVRLSGAARRHVYPSRAPSWLGQPH
ncbi:transposase domain-containing protein [Streptomyces sp. enrichment culture]|uniref:transposase domain-containing protein n=1 Tax=Streptomyces sp. enrichment culture TaxID=1795815 RepID=UPI003F5744A6